MKSIMVTGGLGFIGFNFIRYVHEHYPQYHLSCMDGMTYAAKPFIEEKLKWLDENGVQVYKYMIYDPNMNYPMGIENVDTIVNFAAETHVDNSIGNPGPFMTSNIIGVYNLLEFCRKHNVRFHQIGTDEVYGATNPAMNIDENSPLVPSSPYSSSKASADLIALSYWKTFKTKVTVSRCTNNFGPFQHEEKLLPKTIWNALNDKPIPIYGMGLQRRHWIYVDDHNEAVMRILINGKPGEIYNIAPPEENLVSNIAMVQVILAHLGKSEELIKYVKDRPGHDDCYFLRGDKLKKECKFDNTKRDLLEDLKYTVDWYKERIFEK